MTKHEFDEAVAVLIQRGRAAIDDDAAERVYLAACLVVRHRRNIPDDQPISPTDREVIDVLTGADRRQRKLLKKLAEGLVKDTLLETLVVIYPEENPGCAVIAASNETTVRMITDRGKAAAH